MSDVSWLLELEIRQPGDLEALMKEMVANAQDNEPGTLNYEWSTNADGTVCHIYERYVDSAAGITHLQGFERFAGRFLEVFAPSRLMVYGSPSAELKGILSAFNPTYMEPASGVSR